VNNKVTKKAPSSKNLFFPFKRSNGEQISFLLLSLTFQQAPFLSLKEYSPAKIQPQTIAERVKTEQSIF
jgi:hypothetical protein